MQRSTPPAMAPTMAIAVRARTGTPMSGNCMSALHTGASIANASTLATAVKKKPMA